MKPRSQEELTKEIETQFSSSVSKDAQFTILTIRNLIESNSRVEESIDDLHTSINNSNIQNDKLQKRIFLLTVVAVILTLVQVLAVFKDLF